MAATPSTQSDAIMECAALCERPKPALISESPAAARGTRRIKKMQRATPVSESAGTPGVMYLLEEGRGNERPARAPAIQRRRRPAQMRFAEPARQEAPQPPKQSPSPPPARRILKSSHPANLKAAKLCRKTRRRKPSARCRHCPIEFLNDVDK